MQSPYSGKELREWSQITENLIKNHPISGEELAEITLSSWDAIFQSRFGDKGFRIGKDIFPKPQIMGFLLHELIPLELTARYPNVWKGDELSSDKDLVYIPDDQFSIEVKTSSNPRHIFGNRSYAQESSRGKKAKSGYYLTVNFEKFSSNTSNPRIKLVRFGWLDSNDWIGQRAATGQQSRLPPEIYENKFFVYHSS